jgi:glucokinase
MPDQDVRDYHPSFEHWLAAVSQRRTPELICADIGANNLRLLAASRRRGGTRELAIVNAGAWQTVANLQKMLGAVSRRVQAGRSVRWVLDLPGAVEWDPGRRDFFARLTSLPGQPALYRKRLERLVQGPLRIVNDGFAIGAAIIALHDSGRMHGTFVGPKGQEPPAAPNEAIGYLCPGTGVASGLVLLEPTGAREARWVTRPMEIQHFPYPVLPGRERDRSWLAWVERQPDQPFRLEYPACGLGLPGVYEWTYRRHARALKAQGAGEQLAALRETHDEVGRAPDAAEMVSRLAARRSADPAVREAVEFHLLALARLAANLALQLPKGGIYLVGPNMLANRSALLHCGFWDEYVHSTNLQEDLLASIPVFLLDCSDPFCVTYLQLVGALWLAEHRFDVLNLPPTRRVRTG